MRGVLLAAEAKLILSFFLDELNKGFLMLCYVRILDVFSEGR